MACLGVYVGWYDDLCFEDGYSIPVLWGRMEWVLEGARSWCVCVCREGGVDVIVKLVAGGGCR